MESLGQGIALPEHALGPGISGGGSEKWTWEWPGLESASGRSEGLERKMWRKEKERRRTAGRRRKQLHSPYPHSPLAAKQLLCLPSRLQETAF